MTLIVSTLTMWGRGSVYKIFATIVRAEDYEAIQGCVGCQFTVKFSLLVVSIA